MGLGCVKTLRGMTAPGILRLVVTFRAKKCRNLSSAQHYDQIRFRFYTAWVKTRIPPILGLCQLLPPTPDIGLRLVPCMDGARGAREKNLTFSRNVARMDELI